MLLLLLLGQHYIPQQQLQQQWRGPLLAMSSKWEREGGRGLWVVSWCCCRRSRRRRRSWVSFISLCEQQGRYYSLPQTQLVKKYQRCWQLESALPFSPWHWNQSRPPPSLPPLPFHRLSAHPSKPRVPGEGRGEKKKNKKTKKQMRRGRQIN